MGVGVYDSDFNGTGETFIVSPDFYNTQEDYEAYCNDFSEDEGDEPLNFEDWAQQNHDDFYENLRYSIKSALEHMGSAFHLANPRDLESFGADRQFTLLFRGLELDVGIRGWETDYVIGVAPTRGYVRAMISDGEDFAGECEREFECSLESLRNGYASAVAALTNTLIQTLLRDGYDCRFKTSGYTTSSYQKDEVFDFEASARAVRREPEIAPTP